MNEKNNNNNENLTVNIEISNPCFKCNGDCDSCPHWIDDADYDTIASEAESFRLSLNINMRKHNEVKISL